MAVVIFTVTIPNGGNENLLNNEQNEKRFVFQSNEFGDDDAESAYSASFYGEHGTPAPDRSKAADIILRVTTAYRPQNPERGFVFGRNPALCDILLDHPSISEEQFAMKPRWEHSTMLLINYSARCTDVAFQQLKEKTRLKKQRLFVPGEIAEIQLRDGTTIHIKGFDDTREWKDYCRSFISPDPTDLDNVAIEPVLETTDASKRAPVYIQGTRLGKGANAEVFAAIEMYTAMPYAVKVFKKAGRWREPEILESLKYTNIVRYVAYIRPANQSPQLIMELVNGPDLQKVLQQPKDYPELDIWERRDILSQLLGAIRYVHRRGIIHRDLKPANILLAQRNPLRIKLADFGEATKSQPFKPKNPYGTPLYAAPEMIHGRECTEKVDMFSVGVIALQLLYGLPEALGKLEQRRQATTSDLQAILEIILRRRDSLLADHTVMVDFVSCLLQEKPRHRESADASLRHEFFRAQLDDALVPDAAVPDLATQIYDPDPPRDYTNEYMELQRQWAEEAEDMPGTMGPEEVGLQDVGAEDVEDMPDTMLWGPEDPRADNILEAAPQRTVLQARRSSRSSSSSHGHHRRHREREPSMRSSGSQPAKRHKGKHALTAETKLSTPTGTGRVGREKTPPTAAQLLEGVFSFNGLHIIVVNEQEVSIDASDFRLNATQIFRAAVAARKSQIVLGGERPFSSSPYYVRLRALGLFSKRPGDRSRSSWLPFRDGYFLSQAVGLERELAALFSCADEALPNSEDNYLIGTKSLNHTWAVTEEDNDGQKEGSEGQAQSQPPMIQDGDGHPSVVDTNGLPECNDPPNHDSSFNLSGWDWKDPAAWDDQPHRGDPDWKNVNFDEVSDPITVFPMDPEAILGFNDEEAEVDQTGWDKPQSPQAGLATQDMTNNSISRVTSPASQASHLSTRNLLLCEGLVYMVIRRQKVSMRTSDSHINATELLRAAYSDSDAGKRRKLMSKIKSRGIGTAVRQGGDHHWWLPFADGVFLSQATGLEDELKPLISYPQLALPRREDNYLLQKTRRKAELPQGFTTISFHGSPVVYDPNEGLINATQLLNAVKLARFNLTYFLNSHPTFHKTIRRGYPPCQGTYISFQTARLLCQEFMIDSTPINHFGTVAPIIEAAAGPEQDDDAPGVYVPRAVDAPGEFDLLPSGGMDPILHDGDQTAQLGVPWYEPHSPGLERILPQERNTHWAFELDRPGHADDGLDVLPASVYCPSDSESTDSQHLESQSEVDYYDDCWLDPSHPLGGGSFSAPVGTARTIETADTQQTPLEGGNGAGMRHSQDWEVVKCATSSRLGPRKNQKSKTQSEVASKVQKRKVQNNKGKRRNV